MAHIEQRLTSLGLALPAPLKAPPGVVLPFQFVRVIGRRVLISGHGPTRPDGTIATPFGQGWP